MGSPELVVLDTNVLVSALGWRGLEHQIYLRCRKQRLQMVTSPALMGELERVLNYPKLSFTRDDIEVFITDISSHAVVVSPARKLEVIVEDPDDNRVIECALESGARWIVSGDRHLLEVAEYEEVRIVNVRKALEIFVE